MQIDAVEKRATDFSHVTLNLQWRAVALASRVGAVTAGARIECGDEHKIGRVGRGRQRTTDRDGSILQRLTQHFKRSAIEFWKFIKKQHTVMCETDLAGGGWRATASQSSVTDRMVRFAKGSRGEQWLTQVQFSKRAVDARRFN